MAGGGRRAGAGRPKGSGWKPKVAELRASAVAKMRAIVGSEQDPLEFVCSLAADPNQDVQLRLSAASIALPFLYPKLSASTVAATHTVTKIDHAEIVARLSAQIARLAESPATIEGTLQPVGESP